MKQSSKRFISMLLAIALVLSAFIVFFNFVQPAYGEVSKMRGELKSKTQFAKDQTEAIGQIKKLVTNVTENANNKLAISFAFPNGPDAPLAAGQLNGIFMMNGLVSKSISMTEDSAPTPAAAAAMTLDGASQETTLTVAPIRKLQLRVTANGSYEKLKQFLSNLETNVRIMDVTELSLQQQGKPEEDSYAASLTIVAYYQNPI